MARLLARTPAEAALPEPVEIGGVRIEEIVREAVTWVAPFDGREAEVSEALAAAVGVPYPGPGEAPAAGDVRAIWFGPGQALVIGRPVSMQCAALADQSDAWCVLAMTGRDVPTVLARLTPLDLRNSSLPVNRTARTMIGHMTAGITRVGTDAWEVMVFRSMAGTLVHELTRAMRHVAARSKL